MVALHNYLLSLFEHKKVILSGHDTAGEGEQKLITYIKESCTCNDVNVVYGLDADLIMLSLMQENRAIYLLRDNVYLDIAVLRKEVSLYLYNIEDNAYMYDYIFTCFLLGNDFVPGINYLGIRSGGLEIVCDILKKTEYHMIRKIDGKFKLDLKTFTKFIELIERLECNRMGEVIYKYNKQRPKEKRTYNTVVEYLEELEQYPLKNKQDIVIDPRNDPKWKDLYYYEYFRDTSIRDVCENYLEGLLWTMNYYFNREFSKEWYYKYNYAPCMSDLYSYVASLTQEQVDEKTYKLKTENNSYVSAEMQLLCIMPYESMPNRLRPIATDIDKGCFYMYPRTFTFTTFL